MGKMEIQEVLASETESCPVLQEPRVIYGDREHELLQVMQQEPFDLYIEGAPYPFIPATIYKRLYAKFYQRLTCPLIWLRGVRKINRVLAVCLDPAGTRVLMDTLERLWKGCPVPVHLAYPMAAAGSQDMEAVAAKAKEKLESSGSQVVFGEPFRLRGERPLLELNQDFGLVVVALERGVRKDSPQIQWLAQVRAPLMLVMV